MQILQNNTEFDILKNIKIINELPIGNYEVSFGAFGRIYLSQVNDIILPKKIYSNDTDFIEHVLHAYNNTKGNLGIGLIGGKGLGKSFTGNIIANKLNLPIIRITTQVDNPDIFQFLNKLDQDFVLFIDEFEKLFSSEKNEKEQGVKQQDFLTFLDGGTERTNRIVFIITANNEYKINEFLKNRPSRLKYFKNYDSLQDTVIKEIVSDLLVNKDFKQDLLDNLPYEELNIDVLIQIIKEMNIHNKPYSSFKEFFNFKAKDYKYFNIYAILENNERVLLKENVESYVSSHSYIGKLNSKQRVYCSEYIEVSNEDKLFEGYYYDANGNEVEIKLEIEKVQNRLLNSLVF